MDKLSTDRKKVLFLITKSNWGGAQRYVFDLAAGLPKDQFEAAVALGGDGPLATKLRAAGIRVITIASLERDISLFKEWRAFQEIATTVEIEQPDILHLNSSKAGVLGTLAGRRYKVPKIIFTAHGWSFNEDRPGWQKLILKFIHWFTVLFAHETIAVSAELKNQLDWPFTQNKMTVIHNGRKLDGLLTREEARAFLTTIEPRLGRYREDFWSLTIGELHQIKRHDAAIRAMKEVVKHASATRHLIIGAGEEEASLRQLIKNLSLEENVFLLGALDEAARYLKAADLFILASRSEAMPYALIEAAQAGLTIVATKVGGIPEIIVDQKSGLLTPPLNNTALFQAILELRKDAEKRTSLSNGALAAGQSFNFEETLQKTIALYNK